MTTFGGQRQRRDSRIEVAAVQVDSDDDRPFH